MYPSIEIPNGLLGVLHPSNKVLNDAPRIETKQLKRLDPIIYIIFFSMPHMIKALLTNPLIRTRHQEKMFEQKIGGLYVHYTVLT